MPTAIIDTECYKELASAGAGAAALAGRRLAVVGKLAAALVLCQLDSDSDSH